MLRHVPVGVYGDKDQGGYARSKNSFVLLRIISRLRSVFLRLSV